ncbi:MAG: ATP-binding protein [Kiritimatiellae bacterium]|jgi:hypothetical protein|nr:ATP-binding protein [Kiritimatiellia bacterium]
MKTLKQAHGNWVTGDRFWNRTDEIAQFKRYVREGAHLSVWGKAQNIFSNILDKVEKVGVDDLSVTLRAGLSEGNWQSKGNQLLAILAEAEKPVLLLMDEVPILVNRMIKGDDYIITPDRKKKAGDFMTWLRKNSIEHQNKIHMVISGSIGLEPVLRQAGLSSTVNNFMPFDLKPWSKGTAMGCLSALAAESRLQFDDNTEEQMVGLLGCCIPHHVQMFFDHALTYCIRHKEMTLSPEQAQEVYHTEMLSTRGHAELTHYEERLQLVIGMDKMGLAMELLTEAAVTGALTKDAITRVQRDYSFEDESTVDAQKEIIWILEHDGYLKQTPAGYQFVSQLLREWWKGRNTMFFTPIMKREV